MGNTGYDINHARNKQDVDNDFNNGNSLSLDSTCDMSTLKSINASNLKDSNRTAKQMIFHRFIWSGKGHTVFLVGNFKGDSSQSTFQMTYSATDKVFTIDMVS